MGRQIHYARTVYECPNCKGRFREKSDFELERQREHCSDVRSCPNCGELIQIP